jgi:redox-sensitive bicupin YhaK (pirin superfamily)
MMAPRYRGLTREQIPEADLGGGASARIICGEINGVRGPVTDIVIDPEYLDVSLPAGFQWRRPVTPGHTAFAYVIAGRGLFDDRQGPFDHALVGAAWSDLDRGPEMSARTLVLFGDGGEVTVSTEGEPVRFLLVTGRPLGEPVAWWGPIVMNTQAELELAFDEYRNGTFIKAAP